MNAGSRNHAFERGALEAARPATCVNAPGLRTALWRCDLGTELPQLADSGHLGTNAP